LVKVVIEYKVLELSQLHAEQLLDDLGVDPVTLCIVEEVVHVHAPPELGADHKDVFVVAVLASKELLMSVLDSVRRVLEQGVDILVEKTDHCLALFLLKDELGTADLLLLVDPREEEEIVKCLLAVLLAGFTHNELLHSDQFDSVLSAAAAGDAEL